jgi:hypothetical protein
MKENKLITEGLDFQDMENQIFPTVTVDEYSAKMGKDSDVVTITFTVKSELAGNDLVDWFERGYDYVLDASLSTGEVEIGKWLVFVEMNRRSTVPQRVVELLKDLKPLSGKKINEWKVQVDGKDYPADESVLKDVIICNPAKYRIAKEEEDELNEMRSVANLATKPLYEKDQEIKDFVNLAGL